MTKRWSSTRSNLLKTKRQASKDRRAAFARDILQADKELPEKTVRSIHELLEYLDSGEAENKT